MKTILAFLFLVGALCMLGVVAAGVLDVISFRAATVGFVVSVVATTTCYDLYVEQRRLDRP